MHPLPRAAPIGAATSTPAQNGVLRAVITRELVEQIAAAGLRLHQYRVVPGGSVFCSIAPDDDLVIVRLKALLEGITRLDLLLFDIRGKRHDHLQNIPFSRATVLVAPNMERLGKLPLATARVQLVAVEPTQLRLIGSYTVRHAPWSRLMHRPDRLAGLESQPRGGSVAAVARR